MAVYGDASDVLRGHVHAGDQNIALAGDIGGIACGDAQQLLGHSQGGDDVLAAGPLTGADTFVLAPGGGHDDVNDRQSDGDRIDVRAWGFSQLEDMTITGDGHDTTIAFDDGASVTLVGFADPSALHVTDFLLV